MGDLFKLLCEIWYIYYWYPNDINDMKTTLKPIQRESIVLVAAHHLYRQSAENVLSILVTLWLLWLQLSDTYRQIKH